MSRRCFLPGKPGFPAPSPCGAKAAEFAAPASLACPFPPRLGAGKRGNSIKPGSRAAGLTLAMTDGGSSWVSPCRDWQQRESTARQGRPWRMRPHTCTPMLRPGTTRSPTCWRRPPPKRNPAGHRQTNRHQTNRHQTSHHQTTHHQTRLSQTRRRPSVRHRARRRQRAKRHQTRPLQTRPLQTRLRQARLHQTKHRQTRRRQTRRRQARRRQARRHRRTNTRRRTIAWKATRQTPHRIQASRSRPWPMPTPARPGTHLGQKT